MCCDAVVEARRWGCGGLGRIPSLGRDTLPMRSNAKPHGSPYAHVCGELAGTQLQPILPMAPAGTHRRDSYASQDSSGCSGVGTCSVRHRHMFYVAYEICNLWTGTHQ